MGGRNRWWRKSYREKVMWVRIWRTDKNITGENEAKKWKWGNDIVKKWIIVHIYSMVNIKGMAAGQSFEKTRKVYPKPKNINSTQSRHFVNFKLANFFGYRTVPLHQEKSKVLPLLSFATITIANPQSVCFLGVFSKISYIWNHI